MSEASTSAALSADDGPRPMRGSGGPRRRPRAETASPSLLRRELLFRLRRLGPTAPDQLAAELGASRTGVLQQLRALESANLVSRQTVRHGVGRPRHLYDITPDAQELFPASYDGLAAGLIAAIAAVGGDDLIEQVFEARRRQMGSRFQERIRGRVGPGASLQERARELAVIQDEMGFIAEATTAPDGTIRIREHNCAIFRVARELPRACQAELALFAEVLGAEVVRETHIAAGDRCCTYVIRE